MGATVAAFSAMGGSDGIGKALGQVGQFVGIGTGWNGFETDPNAFNPNAQELGLNSRLEQRSLGQAPSIAEMQMNAGMQKAQSMAMGSAAAQRGINPALAARLAQQQQGAMQSQTNQQAGMMRAQEQMANDQLLQQALQSQRQGRMAQQQAKQGAFETQADRASGTIRSIASGAAQMGGMAEGGMVMPQMVPQMQSQDSNFINNFASQIGAIVGAHQARASQQQSSGGWTPGAMSEYIEKGKGGSQVMAGGAADGLNAGMMFTASEGAVIPGKAPVAGDSKANDKVPTMLSPGEIVVPRSVASMAPEEITKFVMALRGY